MDTKHALINIARRRGWDIRRFHPDRSLDTYLWSTIFPSLHINCVLDVGAHIGEFAMMLRNFGYRGHIASFEPVLANYKVLEQRARNDHRWHVHQWALGSVSGPAEIGVAKLTHYSSFLEPSPYGSQQFSGNEVTQRETVQVFRLDDVFDEITGHIANSRVFLKLDTQGWDLEVLHGAERCIEDILAVQSEMAFLPLYEGATDVATAIAAFRKAGFAVSAMFSVARDDQLRLAEFDCVMVRERK